MHIRSRDDVGLSIIVDRRGRRSLQECAIRSRVNLQTHLIQANLASLRQGGGIFARK